MKNGVCIHFKKAAVLLLICALWIPLTACDKVEQPETEMTIEDEKPAVGGTMQMGSVEPNSLNPLLNKSKSYMDVSRLLFQNLVEYDADLHLKPALAESWSFEGGTAKFTVTLKSNVLWSDGKPVTAEDVKFSLDTIRNAADSPYYANMEHMYSYRTVNDRTIEIVFDQPFVNAADMLHFPVIPKHVYEKDLNAVPVGNGVFKVIQYEKLKSMELAHNEKWSGTEKPYVDRIKVVFISDLDAFSTAFQSKELDVLHTTAYDWEKYSEMKDIEDYRYPTMLYDFVGLNFNKPIFQDKAVRKAILQGINRKALVDQYLLGNATVTDVPVHPDSWLNDKEGVKYAYSRVDAQNSLKNAGFADSNNDGILEREVNGEKQMLSFTLLTNLENDFRKKAAEEIKKSLGESGFNVEVKQLPFADLKAAIDSKQFDAVLTGYNLSYTQDLSFAFHSTQIESNRNFVSYSNPDLDAMLQQAYVTFDENGKKEIYQKLQAHFREELPCISLFFRDAAIVARNKIRGNIKPDVVNPFRSITEWYIPKNKQ